MKSTSTKHRLTEKERNDVLKLIMGGLSTEDIADILHISNSSVSYIRQAYNACLTQDWSTLQRISTSSRATVDWAMKLTGTDKVFAETFPKEEEKLEDTEPVQEPAHTPAPDTITREEFLSLTTTLQDICYLLTEIRDILK